jgi:nickel-dependent lactate racemase
MKETSINYGTGEMDIRVPDDATILTWKELRQDPPAVDPYKATEEALNNPLGMPPLKELANPGDKVVIGFPDRVKGGVHEEAHRKVAIPIIIEHLKEAGVKEKDISLLCIQGLHRKNTKEELDWYLGEDIVERFWPDRLFMHDAEDDDNIVDLGYDDMGNRVEVNKRLAEADVPILLGHSQGNPYGGFSGGYKTLVTGATTWRSIASHHVPSTMHKSNFLPVNTHKSTMRAQFNSIGQAIEKGIGKNAFMVDAVTGTDSQVLDVNAGSGLKVQEKCWEVARKRTDYYLDLDEKFDILAFGEPRDFHYGPGHGTNPILMLQAIGAQLIRHYDVMKEDNVIIAASLCNGWFNEDWFSPAYKELYNKLQTISNFDEVVKFKDEFANNPEYIYKYRYGFGYHPFHAFSMVSCGTVALKNTKRVYIPGAMKPKYARGMECKPTNNFEEALEDAKQYVGNNPRVLVLPETFERVSVHLRNK